MRNRGSKNEVDCEAEYAAKYEQNTDLTPNFIPSDK